MSGDLTLSLREIDRLGVLEQLACGHLSQADAARQLGLSVRQIKRLLKRYRAQGAAGLISAHKGRPANNRIPSEVRAAALAFIMRDYRDFGPTLVHEKLTELHGLTCSRESVRAWMITEAIWTPRRKRRKETHPPRPRRPRRGELIQIDGSPHDWFEDRGPRCTLIVFIDDATGDLLGLRLFPAETTEAYMKTLRIYLDQHGRPVTLYSDRHSIFRDNRSDGDLQITQFGRALETLGIDSVHARTPQAKGRVERANQTLQDRLVKEFRLEGINDIDSGNVFLERYRHQYNQRFSVPPKDDVDAHRDVLHDADELDLILSHQEPRVVSKDLVVRFENVQFLITGAGAGHRLKGRKVVVCKRLDGTLAIVWNGKILDHRILDIGKPMPPIVDEKSVNEQVDLALRRQVRHRKTSPAPDHPWRKPAITPKSKVA
ncbi:MAG: ISNCY family transposase [Gammaproteobacteria bacterium]|nr:ISNCY family transposase [Gammaproteobacteria bacterium]